MKVVEFLQKTAAGKLSIDEQKNYLIKNSFPEPAELAEAILFLQSQMPKVPDLPNAIDVCGTGGSGLDRINTSTISAFLIAACGVPVAKHGNNASAGRFGSFDLLNALNVPINLSNQELQIRFHEHNLAFLYAKSYHPVMRFFAPVRASLSRPTFFNILGPLLSPVKAKKQIIGTPKVEYARIVAETAKRLGKTRLMVVTGSDGLDEVTLCGKTHVVEINHNKINEYNISPADFGVKPVDNFADISSVSNDKNLEIAEKVLAGSEKSRRTDLVLVNTALALLLADKVKSLKDGYAAAKNVLDSGKAIELLKSYRQPSVLRQISGNDSSRSFKREKAYEIEINHTPREYIGGLIAEIKERSPSEGMLRRNVNYLDMAKVYTRAGASAISVLTEPKNFGGSFYKFSRARKGTYLPLLCKDFILRTGHIDKAKAVGADMVLLIVAMLDDKQLKTLYNHAAKLNLQVLVEIHNEEELKRALRIKPKIVGVNSRNLHDFSIDQTIFKKLSAKIPNGIIKVAESGIKNFRDIPKGYDGALVGSEIMKHPFPKLKVKELSGGSILKLCGIRKEEQAVLCENLGVDIIGINFAARSQRKVTPQAAKEIALHCTSTITAGVFENQPPDEVNKIAKTAGLDAVQLSGQEMNLEKYDYPVIKTINPGQAIPQAAFMTVIDGKVPGSGQVFDHRKIEKKQPSLIAGGITLDMAVKLRDSKHPLGFDVASGIETNGEVNMAKIEAFAKLFA